MLLILITISAIIMTYIKLYTPIRILNVVKNVKSKIKK